MSSPQPTQGAVCYRHPRTETAVACSTCERPICTECMRFGAVGIKCPECAGTPEGARKAATRVRTAAGTGTGALLTKGLIAVNVLVFLAQLGNPQLVGYGALNGVAVAQGEWWRLVTAAFLHGSFIHLGFNMLILWWFGRALEELLGRGRYAAIYGTSLFAGAAGALLVSPLANTIGASGAVFGVLGAGLFIERRRNIPVFGGAALMIVVLNIAISLVVPNISLGGHVGGLVGGILTLLVLSRLGRAHVVYGRVGVEGVIGVAVLLVVSVAIAYARVRGLA